MEEEKKVDEKGRPSKLSYEELKQNFDAICLEYNKLSNQYVRALKTLNSVDLLSMIFRVLEHAELYNADFVSRCVNNAEKTISAFIDNVKSQEKAGKVDNEKAE